MCGFVCLWKIDDPPLARRMIEKIMHRGPDDVPWTACRMFQP